MWPNQNQKILKLYNKENKIKRIVIDHQIIFYRSLIKEGPRRDPKPRPMTKAAMQSVPASS